MRWRVLRWEGHESRNARNNAGVAASHQCRAIRTGNGPRRHRDLPLTSENPTIWSNTLCKKASRVISWMQDAKGLCVHFGVRSC
jgi:hypothetical protein